jgi:hypothetical protein
MEFRILGPLEVLEDGRACGHDDDPLGWGGDHGSPTRKRITPACCSSATLPEIARRAKSSSP